MRFVRALIPCSNDNSNTVRHIFLDDYIWVSSMQPLRERRLRGGAITDGLAVIAPKIEWLGTQRLAWAQQCVGL